MNSSEGWALSDRLAKSLADNHREELKKIILSSDLGDTSFSIFEIPEEGTLDEKISALAKDIVEQIKDGCPLYDLPESMRSEELYLFSVMEDGANLFYVPLEHRSDAIHMAAVKNCGMALEFVPDEHRSDAIHMVAVQNCGMALEFIPDGYRSDAMHMAAVQNCGMALELVPENLQSEALCVSAVKQDCGAYKFVSPGLKSAAVFAAATQAAREAIQKDGSIIKYISLEILNEEMAITAAQQNQWFFEIIPSGFKNFRSVRDAAARKRLEVLASFGMDHEKLRVLVSSSLDEDFRTCLSLATDAYCQELSE